MQLHCTIKFTLLFLGSSLAFATNLGYNVLVPHTTTSIVLNRLRLSLSADTASRRDELYSILDCGWVEVCYTKADGSPTSRLVTRNPTLAGGYLGQSDLDSMVASRETGRGANLGSDLGTIVHFDRNAGSLRSFRIERIICAHIPLSCPETNH